MTPQQKRLFDFLLAYEQLHGVPPTIREMCDDLKLEGRASVHRMLQALERVGRATKTAGAQRCWRGVPLDALERVPDQSLADELRRRGFRVTAEKAVPRHPDSGWAMNRRVSL